MSEDMSLDEVRAALEDLRAKGLVETVPGDGAKWRVTKDAAGHEWWQSMTVLHSAFASIRETGNIVSPAWHRPLTFHDVLLDRKPASASDIEEAM